MVCRFCGVYVHDFESFVVFLKPCFTWGVHDFESLFVFKINVLPLFFICFTWGVHDFESLFVF